VLLHLLHSCAPALKMCSQGFWRVVARACRLAPL
jgi:hypothetical protein